MTYRSNPQFGSSVADELPQPSAVAGNMRTAYVAEMVADCYDAGAADCTKRVVRGGFVGIAPRAGALGMAKLVRPDPAQPPQNGFRVARTLSPDE